MSERAIRVEDLRFVYPDGVQALRGITLDIAQGECVALTGPNGSGKTTFVLHLNGIFLAEDGHGTVTIMGRRVGRDTRKEIRRSVGIVFQDPDDQLFMPTVFDDVAFGPLNLGYDEDEVKRRVAQALACVGMDGFEERVPHHLSIGQKKRVSIATVLSMSPEVLVLDEPSASLDPCAKWDLIETLRALHMTKIIVSHDLEMVRALCSRVIILDGGEVAADAPTNDILADVELLRAHSLAPRTANKGT
jgi:cobalt/nickel transport system ATP-binding protein